MLGDSPLTWLTAAGHRMLGRGRGSLQQRPPGLGTGRTREMKAVVLINGVLCSVGSLTATAPSSGHRDEETFSW